MGQRHPPNDTHTVLIPIDMPSEATGVYHPKELGISGIKHQHLLLELPFTHLGAAITLKSDKPIKSVKLKLSSNNNSRAYVEEQKAQTAEVTFNAPRSEWFRDCCSCDN